MRLVTLLICAALAGSAAKPPAGGQADDRGARAARAAREFRIAHRLPALSVAVADGGGPVYRQALGMADVENRVPATTETLFRIASITKALTAAGVLRLADTGRLDLDAPIQSYCATYPEKRWPVSARFLLAHLGGLPDYTRIEQGVWRVLTKGGTQQGSSTVYVPSVDDAVTIFAEEPLRSEPGTRYVYSNLGYVLLGCAIEGASERSYAAFMAEEVFRPLGMTRTRPNDAYRIIENRARHYQMRAVGTADRWWFIPAQKQVMEIGRLYNARFEDTSHKLPAGGMLSTPAELVSFAVEAIGGTYLSEPMRRSMLSEQRTSGGAGTGWGLGWTLGVRSVGLSGGQPGVSATLRATRSGSFAVAVVTNRDLVPTAELARTLGAIWGHDVDD